jgi:hypothetical protein
VAAELEVILLHLLDLEEVERLMVETEQLILVVEVDQEDKVVVVQAVVVQVWLL